ncbi:hypothetical protein IFO70_00540 [Phormidium tenue FACHB-886]|nr:hypothetical protein [Phormidium tenue FACHB-886]
MFLDELTPVLRELAGYPIAFLGGFASGLLRLNLTEEPVKSWLDKQTGSPATTSSNGRSSGPQSISIE